ncbi:MAG: DUF58 domain-containing protein [Planctomycetota bacterium]|nr:MAG: DUF58 domain-containing protein [Planctomycetota bacterium]
MNTPAELLYEKYFDPKVINRIGSLELRARLIVEGFIWGLHKSPYHGFSVEFADHREYVVGDDLRHLDWKVYAKTDRYYIKQYEEETNLNCTVVLDISESMHYGSIRLAPNQRRPGQGHVLTKHDYACMVAASIAFLVINQSDAAGLALFDEKIVDHISPKMSEGHLLPLLATLDSREPKEKTDIGGVLRNMAGLISHKGMVVVVSDLFGPINHVTRGLMDLRHRGNDVIVFHILDPAEIEFPFDKMTLFEGLEEYPELLVDPLALKEAYLEEVNGFVREVRKVCRNNQIDYVLLDTGRPLDEALSSYLAWRQGGR